MENAQQGYICEAYSFARLPNSGVGLLRLEHLISNHIGIHPMALIQPEKVDKNTINKIKEITKGYDDLKKFYIDKLVFGISKIASASGIKIYTSSFWYMRSSISMLYGLIPYSRQNKAAYTSN